MGGSAGMGDKLGTLVRICGGVSSEGGGGGRGRAFGDTLSEVIICIKWKEGLWTTVEG